ncbi:hypothetical protein M758_10G145100 [Ceratodon purpureus]|nr:hypothetical protein M758_10G145100 [Ceratodon purpureus]
MNTHLQFQLLSLAPINSLALLFSPLSHQLPSSSFLPDQFLGSNFSLPGIAVFLVF